MSSKLYALVWPLDGLNGLDRDVLLWLAHLADDGGAGAYELAELAYCNGLSVAHAAEILDRWAVRGVLDRRQSDPDRPPVEHAYGHQTAFRLNLHALDDLGRWKEQRAAWLATRPDLFPDLFPPSGGAL